MRTIARSKTFTTATSKGRKYVKDKKDKNFAVEQRGNFVHTLIRTKPVRSKK